jgi:thioesterase domain-containing protein
VLLWLELKDRNAHIVIRKSSIEFHRPVRGELRARCGIPDSAVLGGFREAFVRKGKGRLELRVEILEGDAVAVEFTGTFVAVK